MYVFQDIYLLTMARIWCVIWYIDLTYMYVFQGIYLLTMARIWHVIGYVDCGLIPIRFHYCFPVCSIQLRSGYRDRFTLGYCIRRVIY